MAKPERFSLDDLAGVRVHDKEKPADDQPSEKSWLPDLHPLFRFGEDTPIEGPGHSPANGDSANG